MPRETSAVFSTPLLLSSQTIFYKKISVTGGNGAKGNDILLNNKPTIIIASCIKTGTFTVTPSLRNCREDKSVNSTRPIITSALPYSAKRR